MNVILEIRLMEILQFVVVAVSIVTFYFKGIKRIMSAEAVSQIVEKVEEALKSLESKFAEHIKSSKSDFEEHKKQVTSLIDDIRKANADNLSLVKNDTAQIARKLDELDQTYVRKDVHDAHLALINERLRPLVRVERYIDTHATERKEKGRKK